MMTILTPCAQKLLSLIYSRILLTSFTMKILYQNQCNSLCNKIFNKKNKAEVVLMNKLNYTRWTHLMKKVWWARIKENPNVTLSKRRKILWNNNKNLYGLNKQVQIQGVKLHHLLTLWFTELKWSARKLKKKSNSSPSLLRNQLQSIQTKKRQTYLSNRTTSWWKELKLVGILKRIFRLKKKN